MTDCAATVRPRAVLKLRLWRAVNNRGITATTARRSNRQTNHWYLCYWPKEHRKDTDILEGGGGGVGTTEQQQQQQQKEKQQQPENTDNRFGTKARQKEKETDTNVTNYWEQKDENPGTDMTRRTFSVPSVQFGQLSCLGFVLLSSAGSDLTKLSGTHARIGLHWEKARGGRGQACT